MIPFVDLKAQYTSIQEEIKIELEKVFKITGEGKRGLKYILK